MEIGGGNDSKEGIV